LGHIPQPLMYTAQELPTSVLNFFVISWQFALVLVTLVTCYWNFREDEGWRFNK